MDEPVTEDETLAALRRELEQLRQRVEALETTPPPRRSQSSSAPDPGLLESLASAGGAGSGGIGGGIMYAGALRLGQGQIVWQQLHAADELPSLLAELPSVAQVIAALASPNRLRIVLELLAGGLQSSELAARLDDPTAGGLYHHLRELLAARLVAQPRRSHYEIPAPVVIPLLTILACGYDLLTTTSPARDDG